MEESMGYERTSKDILSAGVHPAITATAKNAAARQIDSSDATPRANGGGDEVDVWRQARQMRDEWRRNRYRRLKN
jgi:hypothetical protein